MFSFNVHGVLYVGDEEKIAPVEREIRELSSTLQLVKDEQAYLVVRERVHRDSKFNLLILEYATWKVANHILAAESTVRYCNSEDEDKDIS